MPTRTLVSAALVAALLAALSACAVPPPAAVAESSAVGVAPVGTPFGYVRDLAAVERGVRVSVRFDDGREAVYDFPRVDTLKVGDRVKYEGGQLYGV